MHKNTHTLEKCLCKSEEREIRLQYSQLYALDSRCQGFYFSIIYIYLPLEVGGMNILFCDTIYFAMLFMLGNDPNMFCNVFCKTMQ